jgi:hypothetical protein
MFTVGNDVIDRANSANYGGKTVICGGGIVCPVNMVITIIKVWGTTDIVGLEVGMFRKVGSQYGASSIHKAAIGNVTGGSLQTISGLSLPAFAGDYVGFYCSPGEFEATGSSPGNDVMMTGNYCGDTTLRDVSAANIISSIGGLGISGMVMPF